MDRYEEALEKARAGKSLEEIFPELKESEDERIRKELVAFFKEVRGDYWHDLLVADILAYLEKEQKPVEWSEEDEKMRGTCIDLLEHFPRPCGEVIGPWKDCIAWLKSLRPQPHTVSIKNATKFGNLEYERGVKDGIQYSENHRWKPSEEQPEVDLEKEYKTWWNSISGKINVEHIMEYYMHETARHFYELGLNTRKEE